MAVPLSTRRLLTTPELAAALRVSRRSITRWVDDGTLPAIRVGGVLRFDEEAIAHLIDPHNANEPDAASAEPVLKGDSSARHAPDLDRTAA